MTRDWLVRCVWVAVASLAAAVPGRAEFIDAPAKAPPPLIGELRRVALGVSLPAGVLTEWTYHKTIDGAHPDGNEQQLMWLMNRARQNPAEEGVWLATSTEADVALGRDFFGVDRALLQQEFSSYAAAPPAAFDVRLYEAAYAHSSDLIARDAQDHDGQFARIYDSGFAMRAARGNVFSYAGNALNAHAAFNIDWGGSDGTGMQTGRGHRQAIMALDGHYSNVGLAVVAETQVRTSVGPYVVTGNYCEAFADGYDHFNQFVVGTVWEDLNGNDRYDPGEGVPDVVVTPDRGAFFATTALGGGYAIPVTEAGDYVIAFEGGGVSGQVAVSVAAQSVLVDYRLDTAGAQDPPCVECDEANRRALVEHYYRSILDRAPEAGGAEFWSAEIERMAAMSLDPKEVFIAIAVYFFGSDEYLSRNVSAATFVQHLYRTFFDREADTAGLNYWLDQIDAGLPASVAMFNFLFSPEFDTFMSDYLGAAASRAEDLAIVDFYRGILARLPDDAGFEYWRKRFRGAQCDGADAVYAEADAISAAFFSGAEYSGRGRDNSQFVSDLYNAFMRRGGEQAGVDYWIGQLDGGLQTRNDLRRIFLASDEFQARIGQVVSQGCTN